MSLMGHSLPIHLAQVAADVRYYLNSDLSGWYGGKVTVNARESVLPLLPITHWAARAEQNKRLRFFSYLGLHLRHRLVCFGQNVDPNNSHFEWLPIV